jgi:hypothetical protein
MVRLFLYANEYEIEGLVATANRDEIRPEMILEQIEAYQKLRGNLTKHASGYPEADELISLLKEGSKTRNMSSVGEVKDSGKPKLFDYRRIIVTINPI